MEPDVMLITGLGLAVISLPAILSAWADRRPPRIGGLVLVGGLCLAGFAASQKEGGYVPSDVPDVFYSLVGRILG